MLSTDWSYLCFVLVFSVILIASALYVAPICSKPLLSYFRFTFCLSVSNVRWCTVHTLSIFKVFLSAFVSSNFKYLFANRFLNIGRANVAITISIISITITIITGIITLSWMLPLLSEWKNCVFVWEKQSKWIKGEHNLLCIRIITIAIIIYIYIALRDEITSFLSKKKLVEKLGESNLDSTEECY